jgi:hypothetical protein
MRRIGIVGGQQRVQPMLRIGGKSARYVDPRASKPFGTNGDEKRFRCDTTRFEVGKSPQDELVTGKAS